MGQKVINSRNTRLYTSVIAICVIGYVDHVDEGILLELDMSLDSSRQPGCSRGKPGPGVRFQSDLSGEQEEHGGLAGYLPRLGGHCYLQ